MTTFHVRHDFTPTVAREALLILRVADITSEHELLARAKEHDLEIGHRKSAAKVLASLRDLGLVKQSSRGERTIALTPLGAQIAEVASRNELLFVELIHQRYCWLWAEKFGGEGFAWAYQTVTRELWNGAPTPIDRDQLVSLILASAGDVFDVDSVSFSTSSVLGVLYWLRALSPPCIQNDEFRYRPTFPAEALLVALEGIYALQGRRLGTPMYLDADTRVKISQVTLSDPEALQEVIFEAETAFDLIHYYGSRGEVITLNESLFPGLISLKEMA